MGNWCSCTATIRSSPLEEFEGKITLARVSPELQVESHESESVTVAESSTARPKSRTRDTPLDDATSESTRSQGHHSSMTSHALAYSGRLVVAARSAPPPQNSRNGILSEPSLFRLRVVGVSEPPGKRVDRSKASKPRPGESDNQQGSDLSMAHSHLKAAKRSFTSTMRQVFPSNARYVVQF